MRKSYVPVLKRNMFWPIHTLLWWDYF